MNLVLSSESDRKWPKMAKTKIVQKIAYMWHICDIRGLTVDTRMSY